VAGEGEPKVRVSQRIRAKAQVRSGEVGERSVRASEAGDEVGGAACTTRPHLFFIH